jgi:chemotaxis protein CheD
MSVNALPKIKSAGLLHHPLDDKHDASRPNHFFLHAGQVRVSTEGQPIVIILGSCVAVCIWDSVSGIGGAAHYLLPVWDGKGTASSRYGAVAIPALLQELLDAGANKYQLRARVYGGACLFESLRGSRSGQESLGDRNVATAVEFLAKEHIQIVSTDVGGDHGQRIVFQTDTGEAVMKQL